MPRRLRVAGWLRFANKSKLALALRGFAERAPHELADVWAITGLDAHVRLAIARPEIAHVAKPFLAMIDAANRGYVDLADDDPDAAKPITRWALSRIDSTYLRTKRRALVTYVGTSQLGYGVADDSLVLRGTLDFADAKTAAAAIAGLPYRLPFVGAEDLRELELGVSVFRLRDKTVEVGAIVRGPTDVITDPIIATFIATAAKAKRGVLSLQLPDRIESSSTGDYRIRGVTYSVAAGGARHFKDAKPSDLALVEVTAR